MANAPPELERVVEQFRAELLRMYEAGEIGKIECDCGEDRWVVRSMPIRRYEAIRAERKTPRAITVIR
jgi:hypothetical protein